MRLLKKKRWIWGSIGFFIFLVVQISAVQASQLAQQPTVSVPTVTGTPTGPMGVVIADPEEQINVRSGPGTDYPRVGVLLNRQEVPVLGRTPAGDWIQILYLGVDEGVAWVYAPLMRIEGGELPIAEPPPTPTPLVTPTIDPTLASQFVVEMPATRMPTFTPPPQLAIPTFQTAQPASGTGGLPTGFVILSLGILGAFGFLLSLLRGR